MRDVIQNDIDIFNLDLETDLGLELPSNLQEITESDLQIEENFELGDIDIDLDSLDMLDFSDTDNFDIPFIEDEPILIEEDNIDYTSLIANLQPSVKKAQKTMHDSISSLKTEFDIPINRTDFKLLNEVQFHVYYEFLSDTVKKCLYTGESMPLCDAACDEFLKICEESGWFFGLYKDEFMHTFEENYNCLLNEIDTYRAEDSKQRKYLFEESDIEDVDFTYTAMSSIVEFPTLCAKYLTSLDNIDLEMNITAQVKESPLQYYINIEPCTIQNLIDTVQSILKSSKVHDILLNEMNFNTSMVSIDEIIRLLFVRDIDNSIALFDNCTVSELDKGVFVAMIARLRKDKDDIFAFLILSIFYIIVIGTSAKHDKQIQIAALEFAQTYKKAVNDLRDKPNLKTPAFITSLTFSDDNIFIGCSKGQEHYRLDDQFYLISGSATSMVKTPIASFCHCDERNCCGCLFPSNLFISQMIDWTNIGVLDTSKKQNQSVKFKTYLSPKEIGNMISSVNIEDTKNKKYNISQETEKWFLSFQNYIRDFKFVDDGYEPKVINFEYEGEITEDMQIPNYLTGDNVSIKLEGIEQFHGKGNNTFRLIKLLLNGEEILEGDIATDSQKLFISYFTKSSFETQYIEIPLEIVPIHEIDSNVIGTEDFDELNYMVINTGVTDVSKTFTDFERYKHIALVLSDLTGNQYDLLCEKATKQLIGSYGYLLEFHIVYQRMLCYTLSSFIPWLESEEYISDIVNFECLKSLLYAISGENNILRDCKSGEDITENMKKNIANLATDKVELADIFDRWYQLEQDLLSNIVVGLDNDYREDFEQIYYDLLCIPESRDFLLTLQNKMIISMICMEYSRKGVLFAVIPFIAKMFKHKSTLDFDTLQSKIQKNFKQYKNKNLLPTVFQIRDTPYVDYVENISLLRTFTITRNIFGMLNTLNALNRTDMVDLILTESKAPDGITSDYFNSFQNEQDFLDIIKTMDIENMFSTCRNHILQFIYDGAKQDILAKEKLMSVLAYDLLINIYDVLYLDFDIVDTYNTLHTGMKLLPSTVLTYCLIEGEAVFDVNEGKNRVISYKEHPECFPLMANIAQFGDIVDFLYVSGGD